MKRWLLLIALGLASACQVVHRVSDTAAELFGDPVVARVGDHRLTRSELAEYIPTGVSSEDSLVKNFTVRLGFASFAISILKMPSENG